MALIRDCTQHACAFVFGCTGVAMGIGGAGLTAVIGGTALAGTCVAAVYERNQKHAVENKRELERLIRRTTDAWRKQPEFKKHDPGRDLSDASDALIEYLPKCDMSRDRLIQHAAEAPGRPFPEAATDHVLAELTRLAPEIYGEGGTPIARDFAIAIIRSAFTAAIENRAYYEQLEPHLLFKIAEVQGYTISLLDEALRRIDRLPEETARAVVDEWERRGHHSASLKAETIIALARRLPDGRGDLDMLVRDLIRALDAAEDLVERGQRSSNLDKFADDVFRVIAERIEADDFDGAADAANAGFEDWEKREAERAEASRQTGLSLLEAAIEAETARSNAVGIARAEFRRLALMEGQVSFKALQLKQDKFYAHGRDQGSRLDLEISVELARIAIELASNADERGAALNDLGISLVTLGERGNDDALNDAIAAFREVLKEYTREHVPLKWAMTQNNLGNALTTLGESGDEDALHDAVAAFREALKEYTREYVPLDWAMTQNNLGIALTLLSERGNDDALHAAITAYRDALKERTRERVPLEWAMTQNNLGNALTALGARGDDDALHGAVAAFREALKEVTRERVPLNWAMTQNNLGEALRVLGTRGNDDDAFRDAIAAFREALKEVTRERTPPDWSMTQNNLGNALLALGERGDDMALVAAVTAYREALKERYRERVPLDWAATQNNLGNALLALGKRGDNDALKRSTEAYRLALEEFTAERTPDYHKSTSQNLARAEALLEERKNGAD